MSACKSLVAVILVALSSIFQASSAAGIYSNRRLLTTPNFPGFPSLPLPSFPTIPSPSLFPPLFPSPNPDPDTPSVPNLPQLPPTTTFPGNPLSNPVVPYFPILPPPPAFGSP